MKPILKGILAGGAALVAGGIPLNLVKPAWARFAFPGEAFFLRHVP